MARITVQQIAEVAGVSRGTVDRVLHNRPNVDPMVRQRVLQIVLDSGYIDRAAITGRRRRRIGVIYPNETWFSKPFRAEIERGISDARETIRVLGFEVASMVCKSDLPEDYQKCIEKLAAEDLDGLAISSKNTPIMERTINKLVKGGIPVVTFNSDVPNSNRACFVGQDLNRSGRVAAELISKYIRHDGDVLVVAGNLEFDAHMRRVNGFQSRYAELGLGSERLEVVESFNDYGITYQKVREALERKASLKAIYMANENTAACVEAIRSAATPHKVLVACNDLTDVTRRLLRKGRVDFVIKQDIYSQGYLPVMILKDILLSNKHNIEPYVFTATGIASIENMD